MESFSFQQTKEGSQAILSLSGVIDEKAKFPEIGAAAGEKLVVDLNAIDYINSIGIKLWIQWVTPLAKSAQLEFRRCPKSIIFQINMVKDFLPTTASVASFYLPLFCENCDKEASVLLAVASDIKVSGEDVSVTADLAKAIGCTESACQVEIDVIEKKYFRFLIR